MISGPLLIVENSQIPSRIGAVDGVIKTPDQVLESPIARADVDSGTSEGCLGPIDPVAGIPGVGQGVVGGVVPANNPYLAVQDRDQGPGAWRERRVTGGRRPVGAVGGIPGVVVILGVVQVGAGLDAATRDDPNLIVENHATIP